MMTRNEPRNGDRLFRIRDFLPERIRLRVTRDRIEILFDSLSLRQQTALILRYGLEGGKSHTYREVAEIMGVSPKAAEQLIRRTKRRLQKICR